MMIQKVEELTAFKVSELIVRERILVSQIFLYILRDEPSPNLWPFKKSGR